MARSVRGDAADRIRRPGRARPARSAIGSQSSRPFSGEGAGALGRPAGPGSHRTGPGHADRMCGPFNGADGADRRPSPRIMEASISTPVGIEHRAVPGVEGRIVLQRADRRLDRVERGTARRKHGGARLAAANSRPAMGRAFSGAIVWAPPCRITRLQPAHPCRPSPRRNLVRFERRGRGRRPAPVARPPPRRSAAGPRGPPAALWRRQASAASCSSMIR